MKPGDLGPVRMSRADLGHDRIQVERRGVDYPGIRRAMRQNRLRHQRARIKADRAACDQVAAPQGQQIGRARAGADKMHCHEGPPMAKAQVAK